MAKNLVDTLIEATGLPKDMMTEEIHKIFAASGIDLKRDQSHLTIEDLRRVVADYLQEVLSELKESRLHNGTKKN